MQLHRLKLNSPFRGLPTDFELHFGNRSVAPGIQPNCFVGLNGSGKSNVLEVVAEIMGILDSATNQPSFLSGYGNNGVELKSAARGVAFELEYWFDLLTSMMLQPLEVEGLPSGRLGGRSGVRIVHEKSGTLTMTVIDRTDPVQPSLEFGIPLEEPERFLPKRVIGYSSGGNELISNPFIKREIGYLNAYKATVAEERTGSAAENVGLEDRMFFMDYDSNKLILLCNYLFRHQIIPGEKKAKNLVRHLDEATGIVDLRSFSIRVRQYDYKGKPFGLPSQLSRDLTNLLDCATCYQRTDDLYETKLDFYVDEHLRKAFISKFGSPFRLFQALYSLRLYNAELFKKRVRDQVLKAGTGINLSNLLPKPSGDELVFHVDNIAFTKKGAPGAVYYKQLSDGEHQLLHVLGTIILMDTSGALFLLDEPETHFNPEWRAKFVSLLNKCIGQDEEGAVPREQEIILTTHSPFVVSDCQQDRVFLFERNRANPSEVLCKSAEAMGFNTFGASVSLITNKLFDYDLSFGEKANERMEQLRVDLEESRKTPDEVIDAAYNELGQSAERVLLINAAHRASDTNNEPPLEPEPTPLPLRPQNMVTA